MNNDSLLLNRKSPARIKRFEKISFLLGGVILLLSAYDRHQSGGMGSGLFAVIYYSGYIAGGIINLAAGYFYSKIPESKKEMTGRILQSVVALLLIFDSIDKLSRGKILLPAVLFAAGILYFLVAVYTPVLKKKRYIATSNDKIIFQRSIFTKKIIEIKDLKEFSYSDDSLIIEMKSGKRLKLFPNENDQESVKSFTEKVNKLMHGEGG